MNIAFIFGKIKEKTAYNWWKNSDGNENQKTNHISNSVEEKMYKIQAFSKHHENKEGHSHIKDNREADSSRKENSIETSKLNAYT